MITLTGFLLARIAEDEESVITMDCNCGHRGDRGAAKSPPAANCPERVLAECEVKRQIVEECRLAMGSENVAWGRGLARAAQILALPHADHADYREEWKP